MMVKRILSTLLGTAVLTAGLFTASAMNKTPNHATAAQTATVTTQSPEPTVQPASAGSTSGEETPAVQPKTVTPAPLAHSNAPSQPLAAAADELTPDPTPSAEPAATLIGSDYDCANHRQYRTDHYSNGSSVTLDLGPTRRPGNDGEVCISN